jgi:hypothetical protein
LDAPPDGDHSVQILNQCPNHVEKTPVAGRSSNRIIVVSILLSNLELNHSTWPGAERSFVERTILQRSQGVSEVPHVGCYSLFETPDVHTWIESYGLSHILILHR